MAVTSMRKAGEESPVTATPKQAQARVVAHATDPSNAALSESLLSGDENAGDGHALSQAIVLPRLPSRKTDANGFDERDVRLPRLTIVNGNGKMSQLYNGGDLVYGDSLVYPTPRDKGDTQILRFIPIRITKNWRLNITDAEKATGMQVETFADEDAARAFDPEGTFEWIGKQKPRFAPSAKCILVIERPEGVSHEGFPVEIDGKFYAPAVYYSSGGAYSKFALPILNNAWALKEGPKDNQVFCQWKRAWALQVLKNVGNFTTFVPNIKLAPDVTAGELRSFCEDVAGARHAEDGEE